MNCSFHDDVPIKREALALCTNLSTVFCKKRFQTGKKWLNDYLALNWRNIHILVRAWAALVRNLSFHPKTISIFLLFSNLFSDRNSREWHRQFVCTLFYKCYRRLKLRNHFDLCKWWMNAKNDWCRRHCRHHICCCRRGRLRAENWIKIVNDVRHEIRSTASI